MFGIMKPEGGCAYKKHPDYRKHRMHYCGVCKTMGNTYGHKTRFLLSYDTVFLAELLSELSNENMEAWDHGYQAINRCFTMPDGGATPKSLQYAADANLLLGELKVRDHVNDTRRLGWRFASWWYARPFRKAAARLSKWGMDMEQLAHWANQQELREQEFDVNDATNLREAIWPVAQPTAALTGMVFELGGKACGQAGSRANLQQFGEQFGYIAYVLDAFEDLEKDALKGQFNPLLRYFDTEQLCEEQLEQVRAYLLEEQEALVATLEQLPLETERMEGFVARLRSQLALQLYKEREEPIRIRQSIRQRWQAARSYAAELTCETRGWTKAIRYNVLSVAVFVAPQTTEYMGMGVGQGVGFSWVAFFSAFLTAIGLGVVVRRKKKKKSKKQKRKEKRRIRRFFRRLKRIFTGRNDCLEQCIAACCVACACACCEGCCEGCCENACEEGNTGWLWWLLIFGILVIGVTVLLIVLL